MAAGKTTLGAQLAKELGLDFVDLDKVIEKNENKRVSQIFIDSGEDTFRTKEAEALDQLILGGDAVIALGGGTAATFEKSERLKTKGLLVFVDTPIDVCIDRITKSNSRPLGSLGGDELKRLYKTRLASYKNSQLHFETNGTEPKCDAIRLSKELTSVERVGLESVDNVCFCLLYTSPSPRDATLSRMPSSA